MLGLMFCCNFILMWNKFYILTINLLIPSLQGASRPFSCANFPVPIFWCQFSYANFPVPIFLCQFSGANFPVPIFGNCSGIFFPSNVFQFPTSLKHYWTHVICHKKNLISLTIVTFFGYKQTDRHQDRQAKYVYR